MFKYDDEQLDIFEACGVTKDDVPSWMEDISVDDMDKLRDKLENGSQEDAEWAAFAIYAAVTTKGKPFMIVPITGFEVDKPAELIRELANTRNLELFDILTSGFDTALKHVPAQQ